MAKFLPANFSDWSNQIWQMNCLDLLEYLSALHDKTYPIGTETAALKDTAEIVNHALGPRAALEELKMTNFCKYKALNELFDAAVSWYESCWEVFRSDRVTLDDAKKALLHYNSASAD